MDLLGLGALCLVAAEWLALGWLSSVNWPLSSSGSTGPRPDRFRGELHGLPFEQAA